MHWHSITVEHMGKPSRTQMFCRINMLLDYRYLFLELNLALEEMIGRVADSDGRTCYMCSRCGKTMPKRDKMRRHVEVHLDMTHPCAMCEKNLQDQKCSFAPLQRGAWSKCILQCLKCTVLIKFHANEIIIIINKPRYYFPHF